MKRILTLVLLVVSTVLSANAQCNVDSLQTVLNQKITEYNSAKKTLDSLNAVLNPMIQNFNLMNDEDNKIIKETEFLSRVYILALEVNGIRTSTDYKKINDNILFAYYSGQIWVSSPENIKEIVVIDYQGRKLLTDKINGKHAVIQLPLSGTTSLCIAMITLQNGQKISKKFTTFSTNK